MVPLGPFGKLEGAHQRADGKVVVVYSTPSSISNEYILKLSSTTALSGDEVRWDDSHTHSNLDIQETFEDQLEKQKQLKHRAKLERKRSRPAWRR